MTDDTAYIGPSAHDASMMHRLIRQTCRRVQRYERAVATKTMWVSLFVAVLEQQRKAVKLLCDAAGKERDPLEEAGLTETAREAGAALLESLVGPATTTLEDAIAADDALIGAFNDALLDEGLGSDTLETIRAACALIADGHNLMRNARIS